VTWRLKAGIVGTEETYIARQRLGKRVSAATETQATIEELLKTILSIRSVHIGYKEEFSWESAVQFRSSKWSVSRKVRRWRYKFRLWNVSQWATAWPRKLKNLHC
jgi:hypothetical protein